MKDLRQKKLLVLGGNALTCDIVTKAHELGVFVVVTDWNSPNISPAKRIADEYWDTSILDYDKLLSQIHHEGINGIITGFTDSYLLPYQHLCVLSGLPCYATKEQFEITLNKAKFKKLCASHGVSVVKEYSVDSFDTSIITSDAPVLLKPVDNSGSRGIYICYNPNDFEQLKEKALSFSKKGEILVEKYMQCDDVSFEYKIQNGEVTLSSICDRYIHKTSDFGSVTTGLVYPSKYLHRYREQVDDKVKSMFNNIGLKNGVLFMQAFVDEDDFYFYEMGYRLSGGRHYIFTENQNDDSSVKQLIRFALTGEMDERSISHIANPDFKSVCCQLSVLCQSARIGRIEGLDVLKRYPAIIDTMISYGVGDIVGKQGTSAQIVARFHIVSEDKARLVEDLAFIKRHLQILDEFGRNMVLDFFDGTTV